MDTQNPREEKVHYHYRRGGILAVIVGLIILAGVFCVGLVAGSRFGWHRYDGFGMMGYGRGYNMMGGYGYGHRGIQNQVFGTITSISSNQITINNNAGQSQTVITQANTVIVSPTGAQLALTDLKVGQKISVAGPVGSNNQVTAAVINVQP